jgi:hypothetical protein
MGRPHPGRAAVPPLRLLRPFVEWDVLRGARRRADRGRYTQNATAADRAEVRAAILLLDWLDAHDVELPAATPAHLEQWLELHPRRAKAIGAFLRWARARRITTDLAALACGWSMPSVFQDDDTHHEQLRRCLTDESLPRWRRHSA